MKIGKSSIFLFATFCGTTAFFFDLGALGGCSCRQSCNSAPMMGCQLLCPPAPNPTGCNQNVQQPTQQQSQQSYGYPQMYNHYAAPTGYQQQSLSYNPSLYPQTQPQPPPPPPPVPQRVPIPSNYQVLQPAPQIPSNAYEIAPTNSFGAQQSQIPEQGQYDQLSTFGQKSSTNGFSFGDKDQYSTSQSQHLSLQPPNSFQVDGNINSDSVGLGQTYQNPHTSPQRVEPSLGGRSNRRPYQTFDENPQIIQSVKSDSYASSNQDNRQVNVVHDTDLGEYPISAVAEVKTTSLNIQPVASTGSEEWQDNSQNWQSGGQVAEFSDSRASFSTESPVSLSFEETNAGFSNFEPADTLHAGKTFEYALPTERADLFTPSTVAAVYTSSNTESPVLLDEKQTQPATNVKEEQSTDYANDDYDTIDNIQQDSQKGSEHKNVEYFESDSNYENKKGRNVDDTQAQTLGVNDDEDFFEELTPENTPLSTTTETPLTTPSTTTTTTTTSTTTTEASTTTGVSFLFKKARDLSTFTTKHEATQAGTLGKCNNDKLKEVMTRKMSRSASISKQAIFGAATRLFPNQTLNVICSCHSFSYIVVTSPIYCELRKSPLTCFAFVTP